MSGEIIALEADGEYQTLLYLIPIAVPKKIGSANLVPTPSSNLSDLAASIVTPEEKAMLDSGELGFRTVQIFLGKPGLRDDQASLGITESYNKTVLEFGKWYAAKYKLTGRRLDGG